MKKNCDDLRRLRPRVLLLERSLLPRKAARRGSPMDALHICRFSLMIN